MVRQQGNQKPVFVHLVTPSEFANVRAMGVALRVGAKLDELHDALKELAGADGLYPAWVEGFPTQCLEKTRQDIGSVIEATMTSFFSDAEASIWAYGQAESAYTGACDACYAVVQEWVALLRDRESLDEFARVFVGSLDEGWDSLRSLYPTGQAHAAIDIAEDLAMTKFIEMLTRPVVATHTDAYDAHVLRFRRMMCVAAYCIDQR